METIECIICGKSYDKRSYGSTKVCSNHCRKIWKKQNSNKCKKREPKPRICEFCQTKIALKFKKYCSSECQTAIRIQYQADKIKNLRQQLPDVEAKNAEIRMVYRDIVIDFWKTGNLTPVLSQAIRDRDGNQCYICHSPQMLHVHHIVPRIEGGPHTPENLITLCAPCHRSVESGNVDRAIQKCVKRAMDNVVV